LGVVKYFIGLVGLLVVFSGYALWWLDTWAETTIYLNDAVIVRYPKKTSLQVLSKELDRQGVVSNEWFFRLWVRFLSQYKYFQAGKYKFSEAVSPQKIALTLSKGDIYKELVLQITVPECFRYKQIAERLLETNIGRAEDYEKLFYSKSLRDKYSIPGKSIEGYLYPATYLFYDTPPTPEEVITNMIEEFFEKVPTDYVVQLEKRGLSLYEGVVFASLIEKETAILDEKFKISEVIWRRLKNNSPLGIDAAIIYGIKNYRGDIKNRHLRDRKNPYNTRIHKGLPPTPICSPSLSSLKAILNPTNRGYYYYVLIPDGEKKHHFSRNYKEHKKYVNNFIMSTK